MGGVGRGLNDHQAPTPIFSFISLLQILACIASLLLPPREKRPSPNSEIFSRAKNKLMILMGKNGRKFDFQH